MSNEKEDTVEQAHEIVHETWFEYFDAASRELFNAPVSIEIETPPWPPQTEVDRLALQLLTYDRRNDVFEVAAAQGGPHLPGVVRHMVDHPQRIVGIFEAPRHVLQLLLGAAVLAHPGLPAPAGPPDRRGP